jgi:hypothetical protein
MSDPLFLLGERRGAAFGAFSHDALRGVDAVRAAYARHTHARWLVFDSADLTLLVNAVHVHDRWHRVLLLERATTARRELLHALFRVVVAPEDGVHLLPLEELAEVVADERAEDLFIGGVVDKDDNAVVLYRGDLNRVVVPLTWFNAKSSASQPDFDDFAVTDCGQTVRFGDYEAAADAILYEFDGDARRRMRDREIEKDTSVGGALRRLRLARGLSRSDFSPLHAKTIARIERGDVEAPQGETLQVIARRLGVGAEDIKTY